jgi:Phosphodiester glycosidase
MKRARRPKSKQIHRWLLSAGIIILIALLFSTLLGTWTANTLYALVGTSSAPPRKLSIRPSAQNLTPLVVEVPSLRQPPPSFWSPLAPMPLTRIKPMLTPTLAGEGVWVSQGTAPSPYNSLPLVATTFIRTNPLIPSSIVRLVQFDTRFMRLHMVAGTTQPGGPRGIYGPGIIPTSDQKGNALLAAFNGGFMYADGQYGMYVNGTTYVPARPGDATVAVTKDGQIIIGAWDVDSRLNNSNKNLLAWRQNVFLLIDHGVINPLTQNGSLWGLTVLNRPWGYTPRSGLGISAHGTFIYAEGNALSPQTLAQALQAAGAVMAMQTDMNPLWVRGFLYNREHNGSLQITKLDPAMYGTGTEYLNGTLRDFFYLTRFTFVPPPPPRDAFAR